MTRRSLIHTALGGAVLLLAGHPAVADDKDKPAAAGTWARKEGELKLEFADKGLLKISPHGDKVAFTIVCSYTAAKDGLVKAKITDLEGNAEVKEKAKEHVPVGTEFSFQWKVKAGTATLDDLKGDKADVLKSHLEGEYEATK
jgi:hypothetical protein